jgi:predicted RNA binding protein YcfA (HicA-like mRNA interferase family)
MAFCASTWDQIKNKTADELVSALKRDGFTLDACNKGAILTYIHSDGRRIGIHYHPHKTYGPKLLKGLLADIGWDDQDLRRLNLIK